MAFDWKAFGAAFLGEVTEGIEERDPREIWSSPPKGLKIRNLAFDITPKELIKRYVTERGVISPRGILSVVSRKYPWIIR